MRQITDNENENFEILSEEISEIPELEILNANDRRFFDVFLDFWNVNVYPKFVMLARQGPKDGSGRAVELVRRTRAVIALYNQKIKNYRNYSSSDIEFEFQKRFNDVYQYFEAVCDKRTKISRNELDVIEEKINEFHAIINPPKKMSRDSAGTDDSRKDSARRQKTAASEDDSGRRQNQAEIKGENYSSNASYGAGNVYQQPPSQKNQPARDAYRAEYKTYGQHIGRDGKKSAPFSWGIPFGLFCFFAGAGLMGPVGAAIGLAVGLLIATRLESRPEKSYGRRYEEPPSDDVLNNLKNAGTESGADRPENYKPSDANETGPRLAEPAEKKEPGCAFGCFSMFVCMIIGANLAEGAGVVAGALIGFFLSSLISDIYYGNRKDIQGGFIFNGFLIGMALGIYFEHAILGIIFGIVAANILGGMFVSGRRDAGAGR